MSAKADIGRVYSAVSEAAGLLDIPCSHDRMWPALTAFQDVIASPLVFNMVTSGGHIGEMSFDFMMSPSAGDPYAHALAHGLVEETDHPVRGLFPDIQARLPVQSFGVDYGITRGFNKAYAFFPLSDLQGLARLAEIPSMPRALSDNAGTFAAYGLDDKVSAIAIDYRRRTWNVYFNGLSAEHVGRTTVLPMLREFGLPEPSERMLDFIETSSALYPTFRWDGTKTERISFSTRTTDPAALPARVEPQLEKFARSAPYTYEGDRVLVYAGALSPGEEYYKLAAYYQMAAEAHDRVRAAS
ncbi:aromatic prenyltransferase [Streptomyces camelliae]|uniref:Aromatic prenyltransferase n=1 Tax=Streptomyces camelliae TaxID=3004093 RepID=A0ABY7PK57_9ACTN|nr:aromatic prenyltransferase [Streptomyces sp. HUAS 2-6]WBO69701.1 aromatic prenyltransferase [Streptomyces sp. HUAS 2-6]